MNWRIVVAVVVAFVVGAGGGAFAEHERVTHDKKKTASATSVPLGKAPGANWFGGEATAACPTLSKWNASASAAYAAALGGKPWATSSATILTQVAANTAADQSLMPLANANGKAELAFLVAYNAKVTALIRQETSAAAFRKGQASLGSARLTLDLANVTKAAQGCKT